MYFERKVLEVTKEHLGRPIAQWEDDETMSTLESEVIQKLSSDAHAMVMLKDQIPEVEGLEVATFRRAFSYLKQTLGKDVFTDLIVSFGAISLVGAVFNLDQLDQLLAREGQDSLEQVDVLVSLVCSIVLTFSEYSQIGPMVALDKLGDLVPMKLGQFKGLSYFLSQIEFKNPTVH